MATLWGGPNADTLTGGAEENTMGGDGGNDRLTGNVARDQIFGGTGNDTITGAGGNDYMEGGAGSDTFVLAPGDGWDAIGDFQAGSGGDLLDLTAWTGITSFDALMALATEDGGGTVLNFSSSASVRLMGVPKAALTAANVRLAGGTTPPPAGGTISLGPATLNVAEGGGGGTTAFLFTVTRSGDVSSAASVNWAVTGSGAAPADAADFAGNALPSGVVTFAAGQTTATISVSVRADAVAEGDERFTVALSGASAGWTIGTGSATGLIVNDDVATGGGTPGQVITGTSVRDGLYGTAGNDTITGGGGNDYMEGRAGSDTFVINPNDGWDAIGDFQAGGGGDVLDLRGWTGLPSFEALLASATEDSGGTVFNFSGNTGVRLMGVTKASLTRSNVLMPGDAPSSSGPAITAVGWTPASFDATAVTRVTMGGDGTQANQFTENAALSPDGRYVAFISGATNLRPGDTNNAPDLFVKDTQTGTLTVAALGSPGTRPVGALGNVTYSADGRFLLYTGQIYGTNYGDYGSSNLYIRNMETGSVQTIGGGTSYLSNLQLSADGRYLTYMSRPLGRITMPSSIIHRDLETGATHAISATDGSWSGAYAPVLSPDGLSVAFADQSGMWLRNTVTGTQSRLDLQHDGSIPTAPTGATPNAFSSDGRYLLFTSAASTLAAGDGNGAQDVFVLDFQTGTTRRVSTAANGAEGNGDSQGLRFTADGRSVLFTSSATNLAPGDTNGQTDLFEKDLETGAIRRVAAVGATADGTPINSLATLKGISANGKRIIFGSDAPNHVTGDSNQTADIFAVDTDKLAAGGQPGAAGMVNLTIGFAAGAAAVTQASIAWGDGQTTTQDIATGATALTAAHRYTGAGSFTGTITLRDQNGATVTDGFAAQVAPTPDQMRLVSVTADGGPAGGNNELAVISGDGRVVAFETNGPNLSGTTTDAVVVKNLQSGAVSVASTAADGTLANAASGGASLSRDGRHVAFWSEANNLVAGDTNSGRDIFVKDMQTGAVTRANTAADGTQANGTSGSAKISANGRFVTFVSTADNLVAGDTNNAQDVFVKDLQTGAITRASTRADGSQSSTAGSAWLTPNSYNPSISADGRYVMFTSQATDLMAGDTNGNTDLFVKDMQTGAVTHVNNAMDGSVTSGGILYSALSANGRYAAFASYANNHVAGDTNNAQDIFVKDLQTGITTRASVAMDGTQTNASSYSLSISDDGRYVAFASGASNLVADDTNDGSDVFVKDMVTGGVTRAVPPGYTPKYQSTLNTPSISGDGRYVVGESPSTLIPGDANPLQDIALYDLRAPAASLTGGTGRDVLIGNALNDTLSGGGGDDYLSGAYGDDVLQGGAGLDVLAGGLGNDTMTGGLGRTSSPSASPTGRTSSPTSTRPRATACGSASARPGRWRRRGPTRWSASAAPTASA